MGKQDRLKWTMFFDADDFGHAEEQCIDALTENDAKFNIIVAIEKDY